MQHTPVTLEKLVSLGFWLNGGPRLLSQISKDTSIPHWESLPVTHPPTRHSLIYSRFNIGCSYCATKGVVTILSDHASLLITLSLGLPKERLWRLSRYWIMDHTIQEAMQEGLCQYWLTNFDSTTPTEVWYAFKAWLWGDYVFNSATGRASVQSLKELEMDVKQKEQHMWRMQIRLAMASGSKPWGTPPCSGLSKPRSLYCTQLREFLKMAIKMTGCWPGWPRVSLKPLILVWSKTLTVNCYRVTPLSWGEELANKEKII